MLRWTEAVFGECGGLRPRIFPIICQLLHTTEKIVIGSRSKKWSMCVQIDALPYKEALVWMCVCDWVKETYSKKYECSVRVNKHIGVGFVARLQRRGLTVASWCGVRGEGHTWSSPCVSKGCWDLTTDHSRPCNAVCLGSSIPHTQSTFTTEMSNSLFTVSVVSPLWLSTVKRQKLVVTVGVGGVLSLDYKFINLCKFLENISFDHYIFFALASVCIVCVCVWELC